MSVRNGFALLLALSTLLFLAACGSNGHISTATPPPTGGFSVSDLNGTYVFSVSGSDSATGEAYAMLGTFTANGSGGITAGTFDLNDPGEFTPPAAAQSISGGSYKLGVDGRGQVSLNTSISGFTPVLDFVLSSNSTGQITEFDSSGTGSGTLDLQTAGVTPAGSYAFSLSGAAGTTPWATNGNFALTGTTLAGCGDINEGSVLNYPASTLTGSLVLGPSATPATTLSFVSSGNSGVSCNPATLGSSVFNATFDAVAIDATHLKLIEMDATATLAGDAFSQTAPALATGTFAFTLEGLTSAGDPLAAGGFMTTNGSGAITGTEDYNIAGSNVSPQSTPVAFTAAYAVDPNNSGRYVLTLPSGSFVEGTTYAAYPSSGGLLLLEVDTAGITSGAAYAQTSGTTFAATSQGFGLNLSGVNLSSEGSVEVDDIAEFTANPSGTTITGLIDENYTGADGLQTLGEQLSGTYGTVDANGRYGISATTGTSSVAGTLEGGLSLTLYAADGTNFPFVELDSGQVSAGMIVLQSSSSSSSSSSAITKPAAKSMFVVRPMIRPGAVRQKKN
jgi:hypothetical protein